MHIAIGIYILYVCMVGDLAIEFALVNAHASTMAREIDDWCMCNK